MPGLAATLLVRSGILARRVRSLEPALAPAPAPAYGADASRSRRKERV
ncbi:hypothetical protein [Streptomyces sp. NPDC057052]